MDVTIYHNPACGTSRNALELIRSVGIEPLVVEYLKVGWTRPQLEALLGSMSPSNDMGPGVRPRDILREKGTPAAELGLVDPAVSDDQILDAMVAHPILVNRPIVASPRGVRLCRPSEVVLDLLPSEGLRPFTKEDGEVVVDQDGRRVR